MTESTEKSKQPQAGADKAPAKAVAAKKPAAEPRPLPSQEQIAEWIKGEDLPTLGLLFDQLTLPRFDGLVMQIRKQEFVPQHWQVISDRSAAEREDFSQIPAIRRLREGYEPQVAEARLAALETAWRELGGKQPSLWTVADLFSALRRIYERKLTVDYTELFSGARDLWRQSRLPHGREQLEGLWACLSFVRTRTKK